MMALTKARRESVASWFNGDDSSGDDGGDLARGLLVSGGGPMLGASHGLGNTGMASSGMDFDPAEELTFDDLELPVNDEGLEVRVWSDAMRVSLATTSLFKLTSHRQRFRSSCDYPSPSSSPSSPNGLSCLPQSSQSVTWEPPS